MSESIISLENCSILRDEKPVLSGINFTLKRGHSAIILGENGSGKTVLASLIAGRIEPSGGQRSGPDPETTGFASFEEGLRVIKAQEAADDSDLTDGIVYEGVPVTSFLEGNDAERRRLLAGFGLLRLADRGIRFLSNGEMRKLLTIKALMTEVGLIVLDDPFEGLDSASRIFLVDELGRWLEKGGSLVLCLEHARDFSGIQADMHTLLHTELLPGVHGGSAQRWHIEAGPEGLNEKHDPLIEMRDIAITWNERKIFELDEWTVLPGQHWLVHGPNGAGKSTLLGMITGDNVKAYGQNARIFGIKKGSGERLSDLKARIGTVSRELHLAYRVDTTILETVISGLHDTIGIYRKPTDGEIHRARSLCAQAGWDDDITCSSFTSAGFGIQRLALILRAIIKKPDLLILDEPCQGLDDTNRDSFLESLETIMRNSGTTTIMVTHRSEEIPSCITHSLTFTASGDSFIAKASPWTSSR